ncbi:alpha-glucosidase C-terminal domain-containing protein [Spirosoma sp. BT702]|uniref:Alpha-glucosidase C-terminal domain-containing protein n=1 Tax=Spirosoma profusum TaxID=2771354 RepID=A0A926Y100_9BACT|nr:alpha-amylase family glycosyl hydrolase [Spirosoma profusum]MBD2704588.1 alpha-glucosidase C-terminal domain-containing protein [Spirosoma profusum]
MKKTHLAVVLSLLFLATACRDKEKTKTEANSADSAHVAPPAPEWAKNATIYEINPRQFSPQGNFKAIETQLPRLKELGVDIIWFMPIYPISQLNKQGTLGNPYAVADYKTVNPDYGTLPDFKSLVNRAHALGLRVILDWVPSHTGWDHVWVKEHPDWYVKVNGKMIAPIDPRTGKPAKQTDVIALDYTNPALRKGMVEAMQYWVKECDVDGYRCSIAGLVPNDFWTSLRPQLDKIKTVFMLAEWEDDPNQLKSCFNMNYGWSMHNMLKAVAKGARTADKIDSLREANQERFPMWYYQMMFTQNHDENTNNGTLAELFGPAADAIIVLSSTLEGMPLVYNGMESNLTKRLAVFEKDTIVWGNYTKSNFFKTLLTLKHRNKALWNGLDGGPATKINTDHDNKLYAFYRQRDNDRVVVMINLSNQPVTGHLLGDSYTGMYTDVFSHQGVELRTEMVVTLKPWEYRVLTN